MLRRADEEVARRLGRGGSRGGAGHRSRPGGRPTGSVSAARSGGARRSLAEAARHRAETDAGVRGGPRVAGRGAGRRGARHRAGRRSGPSRSATSAWAESERRRAHGGGGLLHRHGPAPRRGADGDPGRAGADRAVGAATRRDEATRQARAEITAAEETARRHDRRGPGPGGGARRRAQADRRAAARHAGAALDGPRQTSPPRRSRRRSPPRRWRRHRPAPAVNAAAGPTGRESRHRSHRPWKRRRPHRPWSPLRSHPRCPPPPDVPAPPAASADDHGRPGHAARAHRRAGHRRAGHRRPGRPRAVRSRRPARPDARRSAGASARTAPPVADDDVRATQRRPPGLRCNRCAQHPLCQCRRSATDPCSPAGHVTRCPVPAVMSWSQPGQR